MTSTRTVTALALILIAASSLTACEFNDKPRFTKGGQFWQRTSASDALYLQGPKAQQMLHRDISRCVTELRELERLGVLKNAIPAHDTGHIMTDDEIMMADWDSPERDKHLFAEHSNYTDFESCMDTKGWERIEHVPYSTAQKGRNNYIKANVNYNED